VRSALIWSTSLESVSSLYVKYRSKWSYLRRLLVLVMERFAMTPILSIYAELVGI
jgi:hypothetical protein